MEYCQHPYFVEFLHRNFHNVRNYLFANSCMSLMFTSQYSKAAQNNQILNLRALDRAHVTTWFINIYRSFVYSVYTIRLIKCDMTTSGSIFIVRTRIGSINIQCMSVHFKTASHDATC